MLAVPAAPFDSPEYSFEVKWETERRVIATIYERNPAARKRCIDYHGAFCCVCDFDFAAVYGEIAEACGGPVAMLGQLLENPWKLSEIMLSRCQ
jgi:hypothetical protein